ncbi:hypothetical protein DFH06DRAFT_1206112 [Mycena polygramma]|nr:hypothetical protein DFH06DRAFT_1206112 [Mycena polygramma]
MLLYGTLLVLLCMTTYLLCYWTGAGRKVLATAAFAMAILATAHIVLQVLAAVLAFRIVRLATEGDVVVSSAAIEATKMYHYIYSAQGFLFITNNIVTDSLFLYRCFVIWERRIPIVGLPILMVLGTAVLGYLTVKQDDRVSAHYLDFRLTGALTLATNLVLMGFTAGRIWWIRRDACVVLDLTDDATFPHLHLHIKRYNTAIAIILESGALNCLAILLYVISYSIYFPNTSTSLVTAVFEASLPQMMNIAPLLMIVRVGLARSTSTERETQGTPCNRPVQSVNASTRVAHGAASSLVIDIRAEQDNISLNELAKGI